MSILTPEMLALAAVCEGQYLRFCELFPQGVRPTPELCEQHAEVFYWPTAADRLLRFDGSKEFNRVQQEEWDTYWAKSPSSDSWAHMMRVRARTFGTLWCQENP